MLAGALIAAMAFGATISGSAAGAHSPGPRVPKLTKLWTYRLIGPGTAPILDSGTLFVTAEMRKTLGIHAKGPGSYLYAFAGTCPPAPARCPKDLLWRHSYPTVPDVSERVPTGLSPAGVGAGRVYVGWNQVGADQYDGQEQAFTENTGVSVFSAGQGGTSTAVVVSGFVYSKWQFTCCGSETFSGTEALNATTGKPVFDAGFSPTSAPAVAGGTLFVASAGAFDAFDASGSPTCPAPPPVVAQFYMETLGFPVVCNPQWSGAAGGNITGTPVAAGGEVYVGASDGVLYAFPEAGCGSATCSPDWTATIGGSITQSVAVNGTTVFVGSSNGMLEAFPVGGCGSATCSPEWSATVGGSVSAPAVGGPLVYVASTNDLLDAFAAAGCGNPTCTAEWQVNCHRPVDTAPAASNGVVFVTDAVHTLHAYRVP